MRQQLQKSAPEPSGDQQPAGGPICIRCGLQNAIAAGRCLGCGCALPGNKLSMKHGAFARTDRPELADVRASAEAWTEDVRTSQGGAADLARAPVRDGAVVNLGSLEFLKRLLIADLQSNGLHTKSKKGGAPRVRSSFALLLQVLDRWSKYAAMLGLDARRREVIQSPREWLQSLGDDQRQEDRNDEHALDSAQQAEQIDTAETAKTDETDR